MGDGHGDRRDSDAGKRVVAGEATHIGLARHARRQVGRVVLSRVREHEPFYVGHGGGVGRRLARQGEERRRRAIGRCERGERAQDAVVQRTHGRLRSQMSQASPMLRSWPSE